MTPTSATFRLTASGAAVTRVVMTSTPHDALFKWTFSPPARAAEQLRSVLPAGLSARLEWSALRPEPGSYVDEQLRACASDLLFSAPTTDGRTALLYLLFEHQSTSDPLMPLRLLTYTCRIWSRWLRAHDQATKVPPVLSVVLHHGKGGWSAPVELRDVYDADPKLLAEAGPHLPEFRMMLDDVSAVSDEALRARAASAMVRLALLLFKHGRDSPDIEERMQHWHDLLVEVGKAPSGLQALTAFVRYLFEVSEHVSAGGVRRVLSSSVGAQADDLMTTVGQQLIEQGIERGIEQGRREMLLDLLQARFDGIPETVVARVKAAGIVALDRWAKRILVATSLDEVFADVE